MKDSLAVTLYCVYWNELLCLFEIIDLIALFSLHAVVKMISSSSKQSQELAEPHICLACCDQTRSKETANIGLIFIMWHEHNSPIGRLNKREMEAAQEFSDGL